jgi:poly(beta-D-mannuronate) lyase
MKHALLLACAVLLLVSCGGNSNPETIYVKDIEELDNAIGQATPGDEIVLANGVWKDVRIKFFGMGTKDDPITLRAETPGNVHIEGESFLHLGGQHLIVSGLLFRNGHSPSNGIIRFRIGMDVFTASPEVTSPIPKALEATKPTKNYLTPLVLLRC